MRSRRLSLGLLVIASCSSCFEGNRKAEKVISQSVSQFHQQVNDGHYHEIYLQADAELQSRISEVAFTAQLSSEHGQLGVITSKPYVFVKDSVWQEFRKAFGSRRELIPHGDVVASDTALGDERLVWAVENDQAKLISYDFRFLCKKPCALGFGP